MTILELARLNKNTPLLKHIAKKENINSKLLLRHIANGKAVIPLNKFHKIKNPCCIGKDTSVKINVNLGTSTEKEEINDELKKLDLAIKYQADAVMDLSIGGDLENILKTIIKKSPMPVGTVPIYQASIEAKRKKGSYLKLTIDDILCAIEKQARAGVDFFTIHAGINKKSLGMLQKHKRILDIVSRGGAILASWMIKNKKENPMYEHFDKILEIAHKYDVTLSLGDALRPGSILDATDKAQIAELSQLGKLAKIANEKGIQIIIEGPGHVPLNDIEKNIRLEKKICSGAPFYVLGPLVCDIAAGYDHIAGAIGGAVAAMAGADFLCYLTPAEHLRHPSLEDVREGIIASKIAAHAADLAKGLDRSWLKNSLMSRARKNRDWKKQISYSLDPDKAKLMRQESIPREESVCTMCGEFCSIKLFGECFH
ncbi:MAG: phosphomethylpyrimidine synthase ThiC [Candidatus Omnitrophota bacterium]